MTTGRSAERGSRPDRSGLPVNRRVSKAGKDRRPKMEKAAGLAREVRGLDLPQQKDGLSRRLPGRERPANLRGKQNRQVGASDGTVSSPIIVLASGVISGAH